MALYILSHFFISTRRDLQSVAIASVKNRNAVEREKRFKINRCYLVVARKLCILKVFLKKASKTRFYSQADLFL